MSVLELVHHVPVRAQRGFASWLICRPTGAFVLQGAVPTGVAIALRLVGAPGEVNTVTVALVGTIGSFGRGWLSSRARRWAAPSDLSRAQTVRGALLLRGTRSSAACCRR